MASIPNMRVAPASPTPGAPATPEAAIAEFFARIIAGGPMVAPIEGGDPAPAAAPVEGEADGEAVEGGEADEALVAAPDAMLPLLQAQSGFPVAVVTPSPAAPVAELGEATPVPTPTSTPTPTPAPAVPVTAKAAAAAPQNCKLATLDDEATPEEAILVAKAVIETKVGKPAAPEGGKSKPGVAETPAAEAPPRIAPAMAPVVERAERPTPIDAPAAPPVAAAAPPPQNAAPALPPFFTPVQNVVVAETAATAPAAPSAPAEVAVERELDLARDGAWLDRLARDIARAGSEDSTMRFRLHPQTLGHMRVELSQSDQGATVRLTVETEAARTILLDAQPRLVAEARAQGVRLAGTEVDLAGSGPQTSADSRRQADAEAQPMIRTARVRDEAAPAAGSAARSDRYA